ncbi:hypothetical protein [uncultured Ramlibacter sp.]|uniref:hypothetical protein n=1 Tax=uncultured Ramlibacter sp. TaxID=260755 RepID=UPI0026051B6A|nr:hypothetical protein [uncultured Ramlibacter sp.]
MPELKSGTAPSLRIAGLAVAAALAVGTAHAGQASAQFSVTVQLVTGGGGGSATCSLVQFPASIQCNGTPPADPIPTLPTPPLPDGDYGAIPILPGAVPDPLAPGPLVAQPLAPDRPDLNGNGITGSYLLPFTRVRLASEANPDRSGREAASRMVSWGGREYLEVVLSW